MLFLPLIVTLALGSEDPVMAIRQKRASLLGVDEQYLPKFVKPLLPAPPLPPIKTNPKDLPKRRGHWKKTTHHRK